MKFVPMNPAAPVTRMFFMDFILLVPCLKSSASENGNVGMHLTQVTTKCGVHGISPEAEMAEPALSAPRDK
jgi:hypothetical protein